MEAVLRSSLGINWVFKTELRGLIVSTVRFFGNLLTQYQVGPAHTKSAIKSFELENLARCVMLKAVMSYFYCDVNSHHHSELSLT